MSKPSYYAIIPAEVRYSSLKPNAKLLYGEITALSSKEGYCFATNKYFANLYNVTKNTISLWVGQLNKLGFISVELIKKGEQITERRIGITKNDDRGVTKNKDLNIIKVNNTNNIYNRKLIFEKEIFNLETNIEICNDFILYWTEFNKSGLKMRFELEKTWNSSARLKRWESNQNKWNKNSKTNSLSSKLEAYNRAKQMIDKINNQ